ncbi:MAG: hypothetical protein K0S74_575 [Chlamydiales bacterium]|jgi:lipopolysaccharide biosynthesis regulator YciM|nr:hypothetical protein [Chlamydiales bacterium]
MGNYIYKRVVLPIKAISLSAALFVSSFVEAAIKKEHLKQLYATYNEAIQTNDLEVARDTLNEILTQADRKQLGDKEYFRLFIERTLVEINLGNVENAQEFIYQIEKQAPQSVLPRTKILKARICAVNEEYFQAYNYLEEVKKEQNRDIWSDMDLVFLQQIEEEINEYYGNLLLQGEKLLDAGLYAESCLLYEETWKALIENKYPIGDKLKYKDSVALKLILRYVEALYHNENYQKIINVCNFPLENQSVKSDALGHVFYIKGLAYEQLQQFDKAIEIFNIIITQYEAKELTVYNEVVWELGWSYFQQDNKDAALQLFKKLQKQSDLYLQRLGLLYQAKIYLQQQEYEKGEGLISQLGSQLPVGDALSYEYYYLRGEIAFRKGHYLRAIELFEKGLPKKNLHLAKWYPYLLYDLGWSYFKLAEEAVEGSSERKKYILQAQQFFLKFTEVNKNNAKGHLALARLISLTDSSLEQKEIDINKLVENAMHSDSALEIAEALFLKAKACLSFDLKYQLFERLTEERFQNTPFYSEGWYGKGLCELQDIKQLLVQKEEQHLINRRLKETLNSFEKAFKHTWSSANPLALDALVGIAQTLNLSHKREELNKAFEWLDLAFQPTAPLYAKAQCKEEILYSRGIIAYELDLLSSNPGKENYLHVAEQMFSQILENNPTQLMLDEVLLNLGKVYLRQGLYSKAEEIFLQLSQLPATKYTGESLFFIALSAEMQEKDYSLASSYYRKSALEFPDSPYAGEAYFKIYSINDYLQGKEVALEHLSKMRIQFPQHPLLIYAYYLLAMERKQRLEGVSNLTVQQQSEWEDTIQLFEQSRSLFEELYEANAIAFDQSIPFAQLAYRAQFEEGLIKLKLSKQLPEHKSIIYLEEAIESFGRVSHDFEQAKYPVLKEILNLELYPKIVEESEYMLAQAHLLSQDRENADKVLKKIIDKYADRKISYGYYLSKAWLDRGNIAMQEGQYKQGLVHLQMAEQTSKNELLGVEQQLFLSLKQGICYRELGNLDMAMKMFSKVINDEAATNLRLEAMFLRSEIYAKQGRHELAIKQLEAIIRRGGEWAAKAKQKLEGDYGF